MSKEWSNSWNSKNWNWHDQQWNQGQEAWTQPETWQSQEVPPPKIRTPPEWKSTSTMYDDELLYMVISFTKLSSQRPGVGERTYVV